MTKSVLDYLEDAAGCFPEKEAYVDQKESVTYRELFRQAKVRAGAVLGKKSCKRVPIVVFLDKTVQAVITFMGVACSGNIYVPFDVHAPVERLNLIMDVLEPELVITDREFYRKAAMLHIKPEQILCIEDMESGETKEELLQDIAAQILDTDPLYIVCTSGSTGVPKGVVISHRAVMDFVEESSETMKLSEREVFAGQAPFYFDASVPDLYCTLRNKATLHILGAVGADSYGESESIGRSGYFLPEKGYVLRRSDAGKTAEPVEEISSGCGICELLRSLGDYLCQYILYCGP